ncbi:MAG: hypothetical protein ACLRHJ_08775 [Faecalimonas umbilicata]
MLKQSYTFQSPIGILTISEADGYLTNRKRLILGWMASTMY